MLLTSRSTQPVQLTLSGVGITNDSGIVQTFATNAEDGTSKISFTNSATAGDLTLFINSGSIDGGTAHGTTQFEDTSSAGNGVFINNPGGIVGGSTSFSNFANAGTATITCRGGAESGGGLAVFDNSSSAANGNFLLEGSAADYSGSGFILFRNSATADHATFTLEGGTVSGAEGGHIIFSDSSTAAEGTFVIEGTSVSGAEGGEVNFFSGTTAGNATIIVNGGSAAGGVCSFEGHCDGGTARLQIFGNGKLVINTNGQITLGSIEGDGVFSLNVSNVLVGMNNLSTTFSGTVGPIGAFNKIGTGTLTLTGANTYNSGTPIEAGTLVIANQSGSGTGTGAVSVTAGTLGGSGIISGAVTVGTGTGLARSLPRQLERT